jgi:hypothetical protein
MTATRELSTLVTDENRLVRAWVNFNGTGTVAIRASFNVSSVTDNGTGEYTINFTNSLTDANYAAVGCAGDNTTTWGDRQLSTYPTSVSACKVVSGVTASTTKYDAAQVHVAIFR